MFNIVLKISLENPDKCNRVIAYALCKDLTIWPAMDQLFNIFITNWTGDVNDINLALEVADGIYNMIPELL